MSVKKTFRFFIILMVFIGMSIFLGEKVCYANDQEIQFAYWLKSDGTAEITAYLGKSSNISIPEKIDGYTVTSIGAQAFQYQNQIQKVELPATIYEVKEKAFYQCTSLESMKLNTGIKILGSEVFANCEKLQNITLPDTLTEIGAAAFLGNRSLESITWPGSVEEIPAKVFYGCSSLAQVNVEEGAVSIGAEAFAGTCDTLVITLPTSLTTIPINAFTNRLTTTIRCYNKSFAHEFAVKYQFQLKLLDPPVQKVTLNSKEELMNIGDSYSLKVTITPSDAINQAVKWYSSAPEIVSVTQSGKITAVKSGEAKIYVETVDGGYRAYCTVTVKKPTLSATSVTVYETADRYLYVKGGSGKITYQSDHPEIAKVTADGKITGVKAGKAVITVKRGGITMKCTVTVRKLKFQESEIKMYVGGRQELVVLKTSRTIKYTTSDAKVATVSSTGVITAKKAGSVKITATVSGRKITCTVTIKSSQLLVAEYKLSLKTKGTQSVGVTFAKADQNQIVVKVSDSSIATVSFVKVGTQKGKIVLLPRQAGTVEVTIWSKRCPADKKKITVVVDQSSISKKPSLEITMSEESQSGMSYGELIVKNCGKYAIKVLASAYSYDFDTSYYDRSLSLVQSNGADQIKSKTIKAGCEEQIRFQVQGKKTWYDSKTKFEIYMEYDGLKYQIITSYYYGTSMKVVME